MILAGWTVPWRGSGSADWGIWRRKGGELRSLEHIPSESELHAEFPFPPYRHGARAAGGMLPVERGAFVGRDYDLTGCLNFYFVPTGMRSSFSTTATARKMIRNIWALWKKAMSCPSRIKNHYVASGPSVNGLRIIPEGDFPVGRGQYLAVSDIVEKSAALIRKIYPGFKPGADCG